MFVMPHNEAHVHTHSHTHTHKRWQQHKQQREDQQCRHIHNQLNRTHLSCQTMALNKLNPRLAYSHVSVRLLLSLSIFASSQFGTNYANALVSYQQISNSRQALPDHDWLSQMQIEAAKRAKNGNLKKKKKNNWNLNTFLFASDHLSSMATTCSALANHIEWWLICTWFEPEPAGLTAAAAAGEVHCPVCTL